MGDHGVPLFLKQRDQPLLLGNQRINLAALPVEEGGDGTLFGEWGHCKDGVSELSVSNSPSIPDTFGRRVYFVNKYLGFHIVYIEAMKYILCIS
ncbi:hypothetical protein AA103193_1720 [Tanticharoenia sakaeratensis NBRC 103193]|nr:hypothetical protein AA103193_1720 [Tanticharoenia sakaeratensis NBRC 103193]